MKKEKEEIIKKFQADTWLFWAGGVEDTTPPCIHCYAPSVTLHEIEPRSTYLEWYEDVFNSVPLCASCHDWAHLNGEVARISLRSDMVNRLQMTEEWNPSRVVRKIDDNSN